MCGLFGFLRRGAVDQAAAARMSKWLYHRGPDDHGTWECSIPSQAGQYHTVLGSTRLAIVDISARGHMPMSDVSGSICIAFNGEIYNMASLRQELSRYWSFRSGSDTEVILAGYAVWGQEIWRKLDGMFAVALWDVRSRKLFLVRDRFGVKPLVWSADAGGVWFASEEGALFAAGVRKALAPTMWGEWLLWRSCAGTRTAFDGIYRVGAGCVRTLHIGSDGSIESEEKPFGTWTDFYGFSRQESGIDMIPKQAEDELGALLSSAVTSRLHGDVPSGLLLSGGADSGGLAVAGAGRLEHAFSASVTPGDRSYDESSQAEATARLARLGLTTVTLSSAELLRWTEYAAAVHAEPLMHGNDGHLLAVCASAHRYGLKIVLSGEGSDEIMGGYVRHAAWYYGHRMMHVGKQIPMSSALLDALDESGAWSSVSSVKRFAKMRAMFSESVPTSLQSAVSPHQWLILRNNADIFHDLLKEVGAPLDGSSMQAQLTPEVLQYRIQVAEEAEQIFGDPLQQLLHVDKRLFLPTLLQRNDRMGMATSIECREPFLMMDLVRWAAKLSSTDLIRWGRGKWPLRRWLSSQGAMGAAWGRKWGFGVPWGTYFRNDPAWRALLDEAIRNPIWQDSPLDGKKLADVLDRFYAGDDAPLLLLRQCAFLWLAMRPSSW